MGHATSFAALNLLVPLMDKCVHCGFCLPTCPSYLLLGQEMDSPRGRIYLMRAGKDDRVAMSTAVVHHFDTCLGCMACETACPSGVRYAPLIEETRAAIEHHHPRPFTERFFRWLLFVTLPYPARLRLLSAPLGLVRLLRRWPALFERLPRRLGSLMQLAPEPSSSTSLPERTAAAGERRARIGMVTGCVQRVFFGAVNRATVRVLSAEGCEVVAPSGQGCCGALALHAGRSDEAREFAKRLIAEFEPYLDGRPATTDVADSPAISAIVVNAAGCGSTMKEYGQLLSRDPAWAERARRFAAKVKDVSESLAELPPRAARHPLNLRVAYHDACHLAHAQGVRREPRQLLESIPGVAVVPVAESEICCGSAGIFNLVEPELADQLGRRKLGHVAEANPDVVVTSNPGCILQIQSHARRSGRPLKVMHLVELLDQSIRGR
jgi:glycolate oxidase iron-sulfur subunit